jgi:hypothetical protein
MTQKPTLAYPSGETSFCGHDAILRIGMATDSLRSDDLVRHFM